MADERFSVLAVPSGFFGKLPSHGDFISRGIRDAFLSAWDAWLQRVIVGSQHQLGADWLSVYLTSPIWRFALAEQVIDGSCWVGVLMPSVDRVGRNFPFTVAAELPPGTSLLRWIDGQSGWFSEIEQFALHALDQDVLDLDAMALALPAPKRLEFPASPPWENHGEPWRGALQVIDDLLPAVAESRWRQAQVTLAPMSSWWTAGSHTVAPQWQLLRGLPSPTDFAAMLGTASHPPGVVPRQSLSLEVDSAGTTHVGWVRQDNQDAWLGRPEQLCWVLADGMGGHQHGDIASRLVVNQIDLLLRPDASFDARRQQVTQGALQANEALVRASGGEFGEAVEAGSTVVALILDRSLGCVAWAGDSRLYRWRDGLLERLTSDHVASDDPDRPSCEITRAVGGHEVLDLEERVFDVVRGDRFLLCSDGVHGYLDDLRLRELMGLHGTAFELCNTIERAVLAGPARDNLTAVVVLVL